MSFPAAKGYNNQVSDKHVALSHPTFKCYLSNTRSRCINCTHFSILNDAMDVYTIAEQMGTSVKMIEQHYGHLKPAQKARQIAGRRFA
jgi:hypothetical protein